MKQCVDDIRERLNKRWFQICIVETERTWNCSNLFHGIAPTSPYLTIASETGESINWIRTLYSQISEKNSYFFIEEYEEIGRLMNAPSSLFFSYFPNEICDLFSILCCVFSNEWNLFYEMDSFVFAITTIRVMEYNG